MDKFFPEQKKALKAFISREDILLNLPTGFLWKVIGASDVLRVIPAKINVLEFPIVE